MKVGEAYIFNGDIKIGDYYFSSPSKWMVIEENDEEWVLTPVTEEYVIFGVKRRVFEEHWEPFLKKVV